MKFRIQSKEDPQALIKELSADVQSTREPVDLGGGQSGCATWDEDGEPGSKGCITVSRLQRACQGGSMEIAENEESMTKLLHAFMELVIPEDAEGTLPWHEQPLIRVVCPRICATLEDRTLTVRGFVYLRRL
jgi:hypothetical protein